MARVASVHGLCVVLAAALAVLLMPRAAGTGPEAARLNSAGGCAGIEEYGGARGSQDNAPAFEKWVAQLDAAMPQRCLAFGGGDYTFESGVTVEQPAVSVVDVHGQGQGVTNLVFPNGGGLSFHQHDTASASSVASLSLLTRKTGGSDAIAVTNTQCLGSHATNRFVDLGFADGTGTGGPNYWDTGLRLFNVSTVVADGLNYYGTPRPVSKGTGVSWTASGTRDRAATGGAPNCYAIVAHVTNSNFYAAARGVVMGAYVQGLNLDRDNFTNGSGIGLVSPPDSMGSNALTVESSQFNTYGPADIRLEGGISDVHIGGGTLIYVQPKRVGVVLAARTGRNFFVQGVEFAGVGAGSIGLSQTGGAHSSITGNIYETLSFGNVIAAHLGANIHHNLYDQVGKPNTVGAGNTLDVTHP